MGGSQPGRGESWEKSSRHLQEVNNVGVKSTKREADSRLRHMGRSVTYQSNLCIQERLKSSENDTIIES